jgi:hypothetical protein
MTVQRNAAPGIEKTNPLPQENANSVDGRTADESHHAVPGAGEACGKRRAVRRDKGGRHV